MDKKKASAVALAVMLGCSGTTYALAESGISFSDSDPLGKILVDKSNKLIIDDNTVISRPKTMPGSDIVTEFEQKAKSLEDGKLLYFNETPWDEFYGKLAKYQV